MLFEKLQRECHWLESMSVELCARCTVCIGRKTEPCARHEESFCRHHDCGHYIPLVGEVALWCTPRQRMDSKPLKPWIEAIEDISKVRDVQVIKTFFVCKSEFMRMWLHMAMQ